MRIAYANALFRRDSTTGGNAHIGQFIANAVAMGHEVWTWPGDEHPSARRIPAGRLGRLRVMRRMDCLYARVEHVPPRLGWLFRAPYRQVLGLPSVAWEFNTAPEFGRVVGKSESAVRRAVEEFRRRARECDLAVCVSEALAEYVRKNLGIERVMTVPNGSDPELFRPDVSPVERVGRSPERLNVVWIGSAHLEWHNLELLRNTARFLWNQGSTTNIAFHIIGQGLGPSRDMPPNVSYYGAERYEMLPHWLAAMDVGLVLYRPGPCDLGSPLKLFDYMASGLAVVATPQPQVREVFGELAQLDLMVPPDDAEALAAVLLRLASDRARVRQQGSLGRRRVVEYYNWRRAVRDIFDALEGLRHDRR